MFSAELQTSGTLKSVKVIIQSPLNQLLPMKWMTNLLLLCAIYFKGNFEEALMHHNYNHIGSNSSFSKLFFFFTMRVVLLARCYNLSWKCTIVVIKYLFCDYFFSFCMIFIEKLWNDDENTNWSGVIAFRCIFKTHSDIWTYLPKKFHLRFLTRFRIQFWSYKEACFLWKLE